MARRQGIRRKDGHQQARPARLAPDLRSALSRRRRRAGADPIPPGPCLGTNDRAIPRLHAAHRRSRKRQDRDRASAVSYHSGRVVRSYGGFLALPLDRGCAVNERRLEPCRRPVRARPSRPYSTNAIPDLLPQSCKNFLHFFLAVVEGVVRGDLWDRNLPSYLCNVFFRYAFALQ